MSYRIPNDERRWATVDFSEMRMRQGSRQHKTTWIGVWLYLLKIDDQESAGLVRTLNHIDEAERTGWAQ